MRISRRRSRTTSEKAHPTARGMAAIHHLQPRNRRAACVIEWQPVAGGKIAEDGATARTCSPPRHPTPRPPRATPRSTTSAGAARPRSRAGLRHHQGELICAVRRCCAPAGVDCCCSRSHCWPLAPTACSRVRWLTMKGESLRRLCATRPPCPGTRPATDSAIGRGATGLAVLSHWPHAARSGSSIDALECSGRFPSTSRPARQLACRRVRLGKIHDRRPVLEEQAPTAWIHPHDGRSRGSQG